MINFLFSVALKKQKRKNNPIFYVWGALVFRRLEPVFFLLLAVTLISFAPSALSQDNANTVAAQSGFEENENVIAEKEEELKEIERKLMELGEARKKREREKTVLVKDLDIIEENITETRLQLDKTAISVVQVRNSMKKNLELLQQSEMRLDRLKKEIQEILRSMSVYDKTPIWGAFLKEGSLADYLRAEESYVQLQKKMVGVLYIAQDAKKMIEKQKNDLLEREDELSQLKRLQEAQKQSLQSEEKRKSDVLARTVAQQKKISSLIVEQEQAREEVRKQIFTLRNAGVNISLTDAKTIASLAEKLTGVRAALLLAVLKVESNMGNNVGSGRYPDDVHPAHREAFLRVVKKLGLDPEKAPVSAKPKNYSGWGGAMGPGQIMPGIWESIEGEISRVTGRSVLSPYNLQDAFIGTAVILRNSGAAAGSEYEAINRYFAGGNWQRFTWYGDRVLAVAKEYE